MANGRVIQVSFGFLSSTKAPHPSTKSWSSSYATNTAHCALMLVAMAAFAKLGIEGRFAPRYNQTNCFHERWKVCRPGILSPDEKCSTTYDCIYTSIKSANIGQRSDQQRTPDDELEPRMYEHERRFDKEAVNYQPIPHHDKHFLEASRVNKTSTAKFDLSKPNRIFGCKLAKTCARPS